MTKQENIQYFNDHNQEWVNDPKMKEKFIIISNQEIKAQFDTFEAALEFAVKSFDINEFIIQQIIDNKITNNFIMSA